MIKKNKENNEKNRSKSWGVLKNSPKICRIPKQGSEYGSYEDENDDIEKLCF